MKRFALSSDGHKGPVPVNRASPAQRSSSPQPSTSRKLALDPESLREGEIEENPTGLLEGDDTCHELIFENESSEQSENEDASSMGDALTLSQRTGSSDYDADHSLSPVVRIGRPRTAVWNHFTVAPENEFVVECRHCGSSVSRGKDRRHLSTSGMSNHLRRHHPVKYAAHLKESRRSTVTVESPPVSACVPGKANAQGTIDNWAVSLGRMKSGVRIPLEKEITRCIGEMMALDHQPYRMVERDGFRRLLSLLAPSYKIPTRHTFSKNVIPALFEGCKKLLKSQLKTATNSGHVHFTTDIWSSVGGGHSFLSLTAHWWEKEGTLQAGQRWSLLAMEVVDKDHKADTISTILQEMMTEWMQLTTLLGFIVTDAGRNMVRAVDSAGFTNITCLSHLLHNTVKDGLKVHEEATSQSIAPLVERCRKIAAFFHRSTKSASLLRERQSLERLPQHRLLQDVPTRWNSTFKMLERMLEQQRAVHGVSLSVAGQVNVLLPTSQEWVVISQVVDILKPFKDATEALSGHNALLSDAIPAIKLLQKHLDTFGAQGTLQTIAGQLTPQAQVLLRRLNFALQKRLLPLIESKCHVIATLCDPRVKDTVCQADFPRWKKELVALVREAFQRRVGEVRNETETTAVRQRRGDANSSSTSDSSERVPQGAQKEGAPKENSFLRNAVALMTEEGTSLSAQVAMADVSDSTVRQYFEEPLQPYDTDPLAYWSARSTQGWSDLSHVARKYLSCPPTSVQSERVFSLAGDVMTNPRSLLDPTAVERLVFLKVNLPSLGFPEIDF